MAVDRRDLRRRLFALAAEQAGYFTAAQARGLGYSYPAQAHHVAAGNWLRIDRGVFRLAEWIPQLHDALARWTLWSRGRGVVSHESALAVHAVGEFEAERVHLTVPPKFTMRDDAVVLHRADLPEVDVVQRTGFRVTTAARALIDVAFALASMRSSWVAELPRPEIKDSSPFARCVCGPKRLMLEQHSSSNVHSAEWRVDELLDATRAAHRVWNIVCCRRRTSRASLSTVFVGASSLNASWLDLFWLSRVAGS